MTTTLLFAVAIVGTMLTVATASATTCEQFAANCMKKGGVRTLCYGPALTNCKKTLVYVGPYTGNVVQATKKK